MLDIIVSYSFIILMCLVNGYLTFSYIRKTEWREIKGNILLSLLFFGLPLAIALGIVLLGNIWENGDD